MRLIQSDISRSYLFGGMILAVTACFSSVTGLMAQVPSGDAAVMPAQPVALMDLMAQRNGLEAASLKPWKMVIRAHALDAQGNAGSREIRIEEIWMSAHRYKISYQAQDGAWQVYGIEPKRAVETGGAIVGKAGKDGEIADEILGEFVRPIPDAKVRASWVLEEKDHTAGSARLKCVVLTGLESEGKKRPTYGKDYCVDADRPNLRVVVDPFQESQIFHNGVRLFQGQFVPEKLEKAQRGVALWRAELESLDGVSDVDEKALMAPSDAKPIERKIQISAGVAQGQLIRQTRPNYPAGARAMRIQGTVVLLMTIEKNGSLTNLHAVSGPQELRQAAVDAVKQWQYRPYLLNGEPVVVNTEVDVVFQLGQ